MSLPEYSIVVLTKDQVQHDLVAGDVGTIVFTHKDKNGEPIGYELEIVAITGESLTTASVSVSDIRLASYNDRVHARTAA